MCSQGSNEIQSKLQTLAQLMSWLYRYLLGGGKMEPYGIETYSLLWNCLAFLFCFVFLTTEIWSSSNNISGNSWTLVSFREPGAYTWVWQVWEVWVWEHLLWCSNRWVAFIAVSYSNTIDFLTAEECFWCADDGLLCRAVDTFPIYYFIYCSTYTDNEHCNCNVAHLSWNIEAFHGSITLQ